MKKLLMIVALSSLAVLAGCAAEEPYETEVAEVDESVYGEDVGVTDYGYQDDWGVWDTWDLDRDEYLTEDEFYTGYDQVGLYDAWDQNRDTYLDDDELGTWESYGYDYTEYADETGRVGREEFREMSFSQFDLDNDGRISRSEWDQARQRFQTTGAEMGTGMGTGQMNQPATGQPGGAS